MSNRLGWALGAVVIVAAAVAYFYLAGPKPESIQPRLAGAAVTAASAPAEAADKSKDAPAKKVATAAPAVAPQADDPAKAGGRGRVYGKARCPAPGTIKVELYKIPDWSAEGFSYDDAKAGEVSADADGKFEFTGLALSDYVIFATTEGYTINSQSTLSPERPEQELTLDLVPGATIAGRVVNDKREPIAGARVFVAGWNVLGQKLDAPRNRSLASQQRTNARGEFTMKYLRKTPPTDPGYKIAVKADGYASQVTDYIPAGRTGIEIVLRPGNLVSGRLVDATSGEAMGEKTVAIETAAAIDRLTGKTDAEGFFFVNDVPPGEQTARLYDSELVITPDSEKVRVADGAPTEEVLLKAATGGKVSGRVYNSESRAGISNVLMYAYSSKHEEAPPKEVRTSANGAYTFKGLLPESLRIEYRKPEGYPENYASRDNERLVNAELGKETTGVDFALFHGISISGVVVDEEGAPVADAGVSARADRTNIYDHSRSRGDGSFTVAGFSAGQDVFVEVGKTGYAFVKAEPVSGRVRIEKDDVIGVKLVLGAASSITGTVVDKDGRPKASVQMHARSATQLNRGSPIHASGADGSIRFDQLAAGEYEVIFTNMQNGIGNATAANVKVEKGKDVTGLRFVIPEIKGLTIAGKVRDTKGQPLRGASIRAEGPLYRDTDTDATGSYTISGLQPGQTFRLVAAEYRHASAPAKTAKAGDTGVDFVLKDMATVEGQVISAQDNKPVAEFKIRATGRSGETFYVREDFTPVNDADGKFRLSNVEDGATKIEVRADGFMDGSAPLNGVVGGQTTKDILVRMSPGAKLTGRVLDSSGAGVGGAQFFLGSVPQEWQRERLVRGTSASDGSFSITWLPAGSSQLGVFQGRFAPKLVNVNVSPGAESRMDIVLSAGGTVQGVVRLNAKPVATQNFGVSYGSTYQNTQADADGKYRVSGLPNGRVNLNPVVAVPGAGSRSQSTPVEVSEGDVLEVNFDFTSGNSVIEGTVFAGPNEPAVEVYLTAKLQGGDSGSDTVSARGDAAGAYKLEGLAPGTYRLRVNARGRSSKTLDVAVGEGQRIRQDVDLFGGATVNVTVSGGYQGNTSGVYLLSGEAQVTHMSQEFWVAYQDRMASYATVVDGQASLASVDPGTYTLLGVSMDRSNMNQNGGDPYAGARLASQIIQVNKDQNLNVQLNLR